MSSGLAVRLLGQCKCAGCNMCTLGPGYIVHGIDLQAQLRWECNLSGYSVVKCRCSGQMSMQHISHCGQMPRKTYTSRYYNALCWGKITAETALNAVRMRMSVILPSKLAEGTTAGSCFVLPAKSQPASYKYERMSCICQI